MAEDFEMNASMTDMRITAVGQIPAEDGEVTIVHLDDGECEHGCGNHVVGRVGIAIEHSDDTAAIALDPGQALALANRITRAANIALQTGEVAQHECAS